MPKKQSIQLSECLELFTTTELLGEHDLWYGLLLLHIVCTDPCTFGLLCRL